MTSIKFATEDGIRGDFFVVVLSSMEYDHAPNLVGDMSLLIPQVFGVNIRVISMNL